MSRTVLITGATDGIGLETARQILSKGFDVCLHGRDAKKVEKISQHLKGLGGKILAPLICDLSSMKQTAAAVEEWEKSIPSLDVLLLNAGTYETGFSKTDEGLEKTMAINHYSHSLIFALLREKLQSSEAARVIWVSSMAHARGELNPAQLNEARLFSAYGAYSGSKLCNILMARVAAKAWRKSPHVSYSLHPGVITTKLLLKGFGSMGESVEKGAVTSVYLATEQEIQGSSGDYFVNSRKSSTSALGSSMELAAMLWTQTYKDLQNILNTDLKVAEIRV